MNNPEPFFKPRWTVLDAVRPGFRAVQRYWRPFLAMQAMAFLLVVSYYQVEAVAEFCARIMEWRSRSGWWFPFTAGVLAGVVIPDLARFLFVGERPPAEGRWQRWIFQSLFFGCNTAMVDVFYHLQSVWFGDVNMPGTVVIKMLVDQFLYTPLIAAPFGAVCFHFWKKDFRILSTLRDLNGQFYIQRVLPILVPNTTYWIPVVLCIYSLPSLLQFPLFIFAAAAWNLIIVFIAGGEGDDKTSS